MKNPTRRRPTPPVRLPAAAALGCVASLARAQWTVINLHPTALLPERDSACFAVSDDQQVGYAQTGRSRVHAALWTGTPASWTDLTPFGTGESYAYSTHANQQVGYTTVGGWPHASLWSGSRTSWVDLHPAPATSSFAHAVHSGVQVGVAYTDRARASLWRGTAATWVDLSPPGSEWSFAYGADAHQQVGHAKLADGRFHAGYWTGTASSWVDLNPPGLHSRANAVHKGQQVGNVVGPRASLWTGSAASWVDLHPVGATYSDALGVHDGHQVGYAYVNGADHASLWTGTAASWVDLHAFLPPEFWFSRAQGAWRDGGRFYVAGSGYNLTTGRLEALLWLKDPAPCYPDCDTSTGPGALDVFDFLCLQNRYAANDPYACNCDTTTGLALCDVFDFLCFQNAFAAGCP